MKKEQIDRCIDLTKKLMERYYHGNIDFVIEHLHQNCLWIGARADEFFHGKEKIANILKRDADGLPDIYLNSQHYFCASHDTHTCVVSGSYIGIIDPECGEILREMQRVSFVWKEEKDQLLIIHMHVSNPLHIIEENESFPHAIGKYTKDYLDMLIARDVDRNAVIHIKDSKNVYHSIPIDTIIYCESFDRNTIIHTKEDDVFGRIQLQELEKLLLEKNDTMFKRVHKSYLLNKYYVETIHRYEAKMRGSNDHISLSQEHYAEIKDWITS